MKMSHLILKLSINILYRKPQRNSVIGGIYFPRKKSKDVSKEKYKEALRLKVN